MNIAVFGDLHGRILLSFWLCREWERVHGERIALALCVGDVGVYRSAAQMDRASLRYAERYPEELGFSKFFYDFDPASHKIRTHSVATEVLEAVAANLYFVPGNHEDHQYIGRLRSEYAQSAEAPVAMDVDWEGKRVGRYRGEEFTGYSRIYVLPEGPAVAFPGPPDEDTWLPRFSITVRAVNGLSNYTMEEAFAARRGETVDIVLSHEAPQGRLLGCSKDGRFDDSGSPLLREFLSTVSPRFHFFGHYHDHFPVRELRCSGEYPIRSIGLNQIMFADRGSVVTQGGFGILRVSGPGEMNFEVVEDDWLGTLSYGHVERFL